MGNRAQARVTLEGNSIDVCDRHGGAGMVLQVYAAVSELVKVDNLREDMAAAFLLGRLLAPRCPAAPLQVCSLFVDLGGNTKYGADNRGVEVDFDNRSVRLYDDSFHKLLGEWMFEDFAALDIRSEDGSLWVEGIDDPEPEPNTPWSRIPGMDNGWEITVPAGSDL